MNPSDPRIDTHDDEGLRKLTDRPDKLKVICNPIIPSSSLFLTKLEYEHYRPLTTGNAKMDLLFVKFPPNDPMKMVWPVVMVDSADRHIIEQVCRETGHRLSDGVPFMSNAEKTRMLSKEQLANNLLAGFDQFPIHDKNAFSLAPLDGSSINSPDEQRRVNIEIAKIHRAHLEWIRANYKHDPNVEAYIRQQEAEGFGVVPN